jgi:hypothetical protein
MGSPTLSKKNKSKLHERTIVHCLYYFIGHCLFCTFNFVLHIQLCFAHSTNNYNGKEIEEIFGKAQAKIQLLVQ